MRRHLSEPFDAGIFQRRIRIQPACDGVADERASLFERQFDQASLSGNQRIKAHGFAVEKCGDGALFGKWRKSGWKCCQICC